MPAGTSVSFSLPANPAPEFNGLGQPSGRGWFLQATRNGLQHYIVRTTNLYVPDNTLSFHSWASVVDFTAGLTPSISSPVLLSGIDGDHNASSVHWQADVNGLIWNVTDSDGDITATGPTILANDPLSGARNFFVTCAAPSASSHMAITTFQDNNVGYIASILRDDNASTVFYLNVHDVSNGNLIVSITLPSAHAYLPHVLSDGIGFIYVCGLFEVTLGQAWAISSAFLMKIAVPTGTVVSNIALNVTGGSGPFGMIMDRSNGEIFMTFTNGGFTGAGDIHGIDTISMTEVGVAAGTCGSFNTDFTDNDASINEIRFPMLHQDSINGPAVDCPRGEFTLPSPVSGFSADITRVGLQLIVPTISDVDTVASWQNGSQTNAWGFRTNWMCWNPLIEGFFGVDELTNTTANTGAAMSYTPYVGSCGLACDGVTTEFR